MKRILAVFIQGACFLLLCFGGSLRASNVWITPNPASGKTEPPAKGGNGWAQGDTQVNTINAGQTLYVAVRNSYNTIWSKYWTGKITSTGLPGDIANLQIPTNSIIGPDPAGNPINIPEIVIGNNPQTGTIGFHIKFTDCPVWEEFQLQNTGKAAVTFNIESTAVCCDATTVRNTLRMDDAVFCAESGLTLTNPLITQVLVFPQTIQVDTSTLPTFSAPPASGSWTSSFIAVDPDGNPRPLGGVLFATGGMGLNPSQSCGFSFAMQGPAADLQYTMYAYDSVMQEFQEYALDLRPTLSINLGSNAVGLGFDSVLGLNYLLQSSPDLHSWQPLQLFTGTGDILKELASTNGPFGFFRLLCIPNPGAPPTLSTIQPVVLSNTFILTFSEPVDSATATDPGNYFVVGPLDQIPVQSVTQPWSRAVQVNLIAPLTPGSYILGVQGVKDIYGNLMNTGTLQFTPVTLQTPCPGGTLVASHVYSECNSDGFWHVVQDDIYACPPSSTQSFRVADSKTAQPCGSQVPSPVGQLYPTAADAAGTCQSPVLIGQVIVYECVGGLWSASTYLKYQCLDGTIYLSGPVQNVPVNPPTTCGQPPPP